MPDQNSLVIWDIEADSSERVDVDTEELVSVAFSPDGRIVATGDNHGRVILWDAETLAPLERFQVGGPKGSRTMRLGVLFLVLAIWGMIWFRFCRRRSAGGLVEKTAETPNDT